MRTILSIFVEGKAQPSGSKKGFAFRRKDSDRIGVSIVDDNKHSKPWKKVVATAAKSVLKDKPSEGPIKLTLIFVRRRPIKHFRTGKNAHLLSAIATDYPTTKPDTTKLTRAVEDALTGVAWIDDAQVVTQFVEKRWGEKPGVMVLVELIETAGVVLTAKGD